MSACICIGACLCASVASATYMYYWMTGRCFTETLAIEEEEPWYDSVFEMEPVKLKSVKLKTPTLFGQTYTINP
jgi:hypothetical protein